MLKEIAIAARDFSNASRGDIIACRDPLGHIGNGETKEHIWMLADVPESLQWELTRSTGLHKRRYQIPFERLPNLDAAKAMDRSLRYQPFLQVIDGTYKERPFLKLGVASAVPDIRTLIVDKSNYFDLSMGPLVVPAAVLAAEEIRNRLKISRRNFAKWMGVAGGLALLMSRVQSLEAATSRRTGTNESVSTYGVARTYSAFATWEAATDNDNVAGNVSPVLECYDDAASFADTIDMGGSTNDATRFRIIRPASGQGHDGTSNNGFFLSTTAISHVIYIPESYSQVQDFIIKLTVNAALDYAGVVLEGDQTKVIGVIVFDSTNAGAGGTRGIWGTTNTKFIINCLANNTDNVGILNSGTAARVSNCTVTDTGSRGFDSSGAWIVQNCLGKNNLSGDFRGTGTNTGSQYNASADATGDDLGATGSRVSQTFTFVSEAGNDFHLSPSDAGAKGFGLSLAADANFAFDDDIDKTTIITWSIGCDSASGKAPLFKRYYDLLRS